LLTLQFIADHDQWNNTLRKLPCAHVLQTWEWGEFKRITTGWTPHRLAFMRPSDGQIVAMASVGLRRIGPFAVMYVSKGPALDYSDPGLVREVFDQLQRFARRQGAIWLKIDPDVITATGVPGEADDAIDPVGKQVLTELQKRGWVFSGDQVQFRNTITLDLTQSEDDLLAAMSQNTRRKVRTGEKKGVTVRSATLDDLPTLYHLYRTTGERDDFLTRPAAYYERAWRDFMQAGLAEALIAEAEPENENGQKIAIAHVILFHFGTKCWYFYGASGNDQREKMPNYLLQWEAIKWAKAQGYSQYDMWGAPDEFNEQDSMWGVYEFKRGFRGTVTRYIGAWDYRPFPPLYTLYTRVMPRIIALMKRRSGGSPKPGTANVG
jgi:lipid II:glycine glycyltransferase (peptidoglycan interpeptide bridge formation enzyme)